MSSPPTKKGWSLINMHKPFVSYLYTTPRPAPPSDPAPGGFCFWLHFGLNFGPGFNSSWVSKWTPNSPSKASSISSNIGHSFGPHVTDLRSPFVVQNQLGQAKLDSKSNPSKNTFRKIKFWYDFARNLEHRPSQETSKRANNLLKTLLKNLPEIIPKKVQFLIPLLPKNDSNLIQISNKKSVNHPSPKLKRFLSFSF